MADESAVGRALLIGTHIHAIPVVGNALLRVQLGPFSVEFCQVVGFGILSTILESYLCAVELTVEVGDRSL